MGGDRTERLNLIILGVDDIRDALYGPCQRTLSTTDDQHRRWGWGDPKTWGEDGRRRLHLADQAGQYGDRVYQRHQSCPMRKNAKQPLWAVGEVNQPRPLCQYPAQPL